MWCETCKKQTVPIPSQQADTYCCAECGDALFGEKTPDSAIRQARDIVARWSSNDLLDQISALPEIPAMPKPHFMQHADYQKQDDPADEEQTIGHGESDTALLDRPSEQLTSEEDTQFAVPQFPRVERPATDEPDVPDSTPVQASPSDETVRKSDVPDPTASSDEIVSGLLAKQDSDPPSGSDSTRNVPPAVTPEPEVDGTSRKQQHRKVQPRTEQVRTNPKSQPTVNSNSQKGPSVNRKIRIDVPADPTAGLQPADARIDAEAPEAAAQPPQRTTAVPHEANVQETSTGQKVRSNAGKPSRRTRIDSGESVESTLGTGSRPRPHSKPRQRYIDDAHASTMRGPHFQPVPNRRTNFTSITGQFLAYVGVLGLTVGTAIVIYGHFGGYSDYTPTGWLVTTVAQMMLFLGVINLVSGGIEQTNDDVSQRIDYLGAQLMRIEQVTEQALRGPKISPRRYAGQTVEAEESAAVQQEV